MQNVLGFGKRLVVWTSGCPFSCDGCIVEELQDGKLGKHYSVEEFYTIIKTYLPKIDGITFSGGEPLVQSDELIKLLNLLPSHLDKMLFSGFKYSELNAIQLACFNLFDLVIEGRFEKEKMGNLLWRGSSNQKIFSPTQKYNTIIDDIYKSKSVGLDIKIDANNILFYGIPTTNEEIATIKQILNKNNIQSNAINL